MNNEPTEPIQATAPPETLAAAMSPLELVRTFIFLGLQVGFLIASPWTGGFHNKIWSMLDSAILISSIGITGLVFIVESKTARRIVFKIAIVLYVLAVLDMSVNVLLTGWLGWEPIGLGN